MGELFRMLADIKRDCHPTMVEQMIKLESTLDSALQQAYRQGWEQCKMEALNISKVGCATSEEQAELRYGKHWRAEAIASMSYDVANSKAALEYKEQTNDR